MNLFLGYKVRVVISYDRCFLSENKKMMATSSLSRQIPTVFP